MNVANLTPAIGTLTPLQLVAGAGLLQNSGIAPSAELISAATAYNSLPAVAPLLNTLSVGSTGNILTSNTVVAVGTLGSNSCPALSDSVPSAFVSSIPVSTSPPGFTGTLVARAQMYTGNGDVSKFAQALSALQAYGTQTNTYINSAVNSQTYLGGVFPGTDAMVTSLLTQVTGATAIFGKDLQNLGLLIDLSNLNDFGSPLALYRQIYNICNGVPALLNRFVAAGISQEIIITLTDPSVAVSDTTQRMMYEAMTQVTGSELASVIKIFKITTENITTMADLLNPVKLFPNSYWMITAPVATGQANVYINQSASVNSSLSTTLPPYVLSSTS